MGIEVLMDNYTIVISDSGLRKKITKVMQLRDGGFAIASPYHSAKTGYMFKHIADYSKDEFLIPTEEVTMEYTASDLVKLSMHWDGFVQFSKAGVKQIISGRDPVTGEPKGMGYMSYPLSTPIRSGPTVGISLWGLDDFDDFIKPKKRENVIEFKKEDLYFRSNPNKCNSYILEFFVFPNNEIANYVAKIGNNRYLRTAFHNYKHLPGAIMTVRIIPLLKSVSLGLLVFKSENSLPDSGFTLNAPVDKGSHSGNTGYVMHAIYPNFTKQKPKNSLDYVPEKEDNRTDGN